MKVFELPQNTEYNNFNDAKFSILLPIAKYSKSLTVDQPLIYQWLEFESQLCDVLCDRLYVITAMLLLLLDLWHQNHFAKDSFHNDLHFLHSKRKEEKNLKYFLFFTFLFRI